MQSVSTDELGSFELISSHTDDLLPENEAKQSAEETTGEEGEDSDEEVEELLRKGKAEDALRASDTSPNARGSGAVGKSGLRGGLRKEWWKAGLFSMTRVERKHLRKEMLTQVRTSNSSDRVSLEQASNIPYG